MFSAVPNCVRNRFKGVQCGFTIGAAICGRFVFGCGDRGRVFEKIDAMKSKGLRFNMDKAKVMCCKVRNRQADISGK